VVRSWTKAPFDTVVAGEVHPHPQILLFGNAPTAILHWWVPPLTVAQPGLPHSRPQILLFGNAHTVILHCWVPPLTMAQPQVTSLAATNIIVW